jgi:hypothetical protein
MDLYNDDHTKVAPPEAVQQTVPDFYTDPHVYAFKRIKAGQVWEEVATGSKIVVLKNERSVFWIDQEDNHFYTTRRAFVSKFSLVESFYD